MTDIPTLHKRKLQAEVIGPIYREMVETIGAEAARGILDRAIVKAAVDEGRAFAARAGGRTTMQDFIRLYDLWTADDALQIEVLAADDERFDFDVLRCRYAETYREMGLGDIGPLLSCNRDGTFCQGYNPDIELTREKTIMGGATRCTFRYRMRRPDDTAR